MIERDNQPGSYAEIKTLRVVDLASVELAAHDATLPVLEKSAAVDLLAEMRADNGWLWDKPEGLAVTADERVFLATDNDGVGDSTGETQFIELGSAGELF